MSPAQREKRLALALRNSDQGPDGIVSATHPIILTVKVIGLSIMVLSLT
jgi:hypothetical protein